jgi:uncharacterized protein YecT (DUF1311 family)
MIDVFISYARSDRDRAQELAHALEEQGFSVWWDWNLVGGENFRKAIRKAISDAEKVIVLWSARSIDSAFVIDEASSAKKQGKLVPVSIDGSPAPYGFGDLHVITLKNTAAGLNQVIAALEGRVLRGGPARRRQFPRSSWLVAGLAALVAAGPLAYWLHSQPSGTSSSVGRMGTTPATVETIVATADGVTSTSGESGSQQAHYPVDPDRAAPRHPDTTEGGPASPTQGDSSAHSVCVVTDPEPPLNVRERPQGRIVQTLANDTPVLIADVGNDAKGQPWVLVASNSGERLGWVFRRYITCSMDSGAAKTGYANVAASGPSFDCAKNTSLGEQAICSNPELANLDAELADTYYRVFRQLSLMGRSQLHDQQLAWMQNRSSCNDDARCIRTVYMNRLQELKARLP